MKKLDVLKCYVKDRIYTILLIGFVMVIYTIVYFVYNVDMEPFLYASYLVCLSGMLFLCLDFYRYYKKHTFLMKMKENILYSNDFPKDKSLIDHDYHILIQTLKQMNHKNNEMNKQRF